MMDTLAIVKKMTAAGMPTAQAEAVAQTLVDTVDMELATKRDVQDVETKLDSVEGTLRRDLKDVEAGLKRDIKELETNVKRDIKELETNVKRDIKELELKTEKLLADMQRQNLQVGLAMALFTITVLGFLFRFLR